jgi:hypothetical protein
MPSPWDRGVVSVGSECPLPVSRLNANLNSLSYMEVRLIMDKLLWHSDIESVGGSDSWSPESEYRNMRVYNWMKPPLHVKLTPRKN